jgi:flagellar motor protein MotB
VGLDHGRRWLERDAVRYLGRRLRPEPYREPGPALQLRCHRGSAAAYARSGNPTRVLVVGHTDTSGSAAYNLGLSNRRARTVADALVAAGVNGGVVSLDGRGETQLARATADGVREPLNRRATVDINF